MKLMHERSAHQRGVGRLPPSCLNCLARVLSTMLEVDERWCLRSAAQFRNGCSSRTKMASFTPLSSHLFPLGETAFFGTC